MNKETDMKTRILDEATRLIAERGFEGVTIQAVASAVGIRKPSLLYHFGNKDALRRAVLDKLLAHWKEDLPRLLLATQKGGERLDAALNALVGFFLEEPSRARLLLRECMDDPERVREVLRDHIQPWTGLMTDFIRQGQESGIVHPDLHPESYVLQVVHMTVGTVAAGSVTASMLPDHEDPVQHQINELVRMARAALFLPRPERS